MKNYLSNLKKYIYKFDTIRTKNKSGLLNFIDLPIEFNVKRIFTLTDFDDLEQNNKKRGLHVNTNCDELIIVNSGYIDFKVIDKDQNFADIRINKNEMLFFPRNYWFEFEIGTKDTEIIVLANIMHKESINCYDFNRYINHYVFDFDGTLIKSMNIDYNKMKTELKNILKTDEELTPMYEIINKNEKYKDECYNLIDKYELEVIDECIINHEIIELYLKQKVKIIVSRNGEKVISRFFKKNNIEYPDMILCRDNVMNMKPNIDHIKPIFDKYDFITNENLIIVGDSCHDEQLSENINAKFMQV